MRNKLFISKDRNELDELAKFCESRNIDLIASSQIKFTSVPFEIQEEYDVIFFSSIRAAQFFLSQEKISDKTKIACIGGVTAKKLKEVGINTDFIGERAGEPENVALAFKTWLGNRKVLIPCSDISNQSIATTLSEEQFEEIVVYKTENNCSPIKESNVYVFTSPSNFKSFISCNQLEKSSNIIAWGQTTEAVLKKTGYEVLHTLHNSNSTELIEYLSVSDLFHYER